MNVDLADIERVAKELYVRALKILPPDIKAGFARLATAETTPTGRRVLATMVENIAVAERTDNLLCQDTGVPIYNVRIGRGVAVDAAVLEANPERHVPAQAAERVEWNRQLLYAPRLGGRRRQV